MSKLIEFSGTPDAGKTTLIKSLDSELTKNGLSVINLGEANGESLPPQNLRGSLAYNEWVGENACNGILIALSKNPDVILIDRGLLDFRFWNYFYKNTGKATPEDVSVLQQKPIFQRKEIIPDLFIAVTVSLEKAITRNPSLARKKDLITTHNNLFDKFYNTYKGNKVHIDTSELSKEETVSASLTIIQKKFPELFQIQEL